LKNSRGRGEEEKGRRREGEKERRREFLLDTSWCHMKTNT
jgi:hypothetical protein